MLVKIAHKRIALTAAAAVLGSSLTVAASAQAHTSRPQQPTAAAAANVRAGGQSMKLAPAALTSLRGKQAASGNFSYLQFKKGSNPQNSRLYFVFVQATNPDHVHSWTLGSWRAGSGTGSKNTCASNHGWLPNGTYTIKAFYKHHNGGLHGVNGIAWYIGNHNCQTGHPRTDLFVHSEMLPSGKAGTAEPYRWDGNSDYKSNGCIKLKPADIRSLRDLQSGYPDPHKLYVS
ncbi:hypothetical protein ACFV2U_40130 [Streptomyces sp. NPDC059697]|uniref:hypothetical protein n=1 Tax=Streptomyces sp. NPDC059697 TaxID=3346912 RepID=UPI003677FF06